MRARARQPLGGEPHRLDDLLVAGAAAEVAADRLPDLRVARPRVATQAAPAPRSAGPRCSSRIAGRAFSQKLSCSTLSDPSAGREALDRRHAVAVGLHCVHQAGAHRLAVEQDRAGAADAVLATDVGAGQAQIVAQPVDQRQARVRPAPCAGRR